MGGETEDEGLPRERRKQDGKGKKRERKRKIKTNGKNGFMEGGERKVKDRS